MAGTLEDLRWAGVNVALSATNHISTIQMYRDEMVRPSLRALDQKIEAMSNSDEPSDIFGREDFTELRQSTIEGYLLTTQSMWERGLRELMVGAASQKRETPKNIDAIKSARWSVKDGIQAHFRALFNTSMDLFGCPGDLQVLQVMGNALRHGNGRSAELLHELCPSLWTHWLPPGTVIMAGSCDFRVFIDAPRHPSFDDIKLPTCVLEQMMLTVLWFWEDVEFVRCNSFARKASSVVMKLEEMRDNRMNRPKQRFWVPH
jgi:hypothetical protein